MRGGADLCVDRLALRLRYPFDLARIIGDATDFAAGAEQSDDITCLALVFRP